jgi:hypothetical protein
MYKSMLINNMVILASCVALCIPPSQNKDEYTENLLHVERGYMLISVVFKNIIGFPGQNIFYHGNSDSLTRSLCCTFSTISRPS